jgi:hypothetical protein
MIVANNNLVYVWSSFIVTWVVFIGYAIRAHAALSRARAEHDAVMANSEHAS